MSKEELKELEEHFEKLLAQVNTWNSFAEAKNAALIVFNITLIGFGMQLWQYNSIMVTITLVILFISTGFCLCSFIPNLTSKVSQNKKNILKNEMGKTSVSKNMKNGNLMFFGDIALYSDCESFINETILKYYPNQSLDIKKDKEDMNKVNDLAYEVWTNSKIATQKYEKFNYAIKIVFIPLVFFVALLIIA